MSIADSMAETYREEDAAEQRRRDKFGPYIDEECAHCARQRVMTGKDGRHRCEKCGWCPEDQCFDTEVTRD